MRSFIWQKKREETKLSPDLFGFLERKPLFYKEIDYTRMPRIFDKVRHHFKVPKIIHITGTNGKGTTGRFLATALWRAGKSVAHYTSPHIMRFNERIWINGKDVDDTTLQRAHEKLLKILDSRDAEALSYFEYTTLLAMLCFEECEYAVLEAGLGGEHDATAVFEKKLSILTTVDMDHEEFLGGSIEAITKTKLGAAAGKILLAKQRHAKVYEVAKEVAKRKKAELFSVEQVLGQKAYEVVSKVAQQDFLPHYMQQNLHTAMAAMELLGERYDASSFEGAALFGRLTPVAKNVLLDVGHNPLAAAAIKEALAPKRYVLVYNSFRDKDYRTILSILKPIVKRVEIIAIDDQRAEEPQKLQRTLNELRIQYSSFNQIQHDEHYLVFGSFSVAEEFLKRFHA